MVHQNEWKKEVEEEKKFVLHKYRKFMQMTIWWSSYHGFFLHIIFCRFVW